MHEIANKHLFEHIFARNEECALHNQMHFNEENILVFNLMSAPGSGKTSLLESIIDFLPKKFKFHVIEGDMVGNLDAERLQKKGVSVEQISTGKACHLDANMVSNVLHARKILNCDFLFIENVGNLVCPADFNLGEHKRIVLFSITEGDDKAIKYPNIFRKADIVVFTKCDLLSYVFFDLDKAKHTIRNLNSQIRFFEISNFTKFGIEDFVSYIVQLKEQI